MVITRLVGGLGNQLFQYATGRAVAEARGSQLLLDITAYSDDPLCREYRLDRFRIRASLASTEDTYSTTRRGRTDLLSRIRRRVDPLLPIGFRNTYVDRKEGYDQGILRTSQRVMLIGYWQSERYFASIEDSLREELTLREPPTGLNARLAAEITESVSVCIHVRRGDYVVNETHVALPTYYYRAARRRISSSLHRPIFYVFSDDIPWCREKLNFLSNVVFVDHNGPDKDYEDLRLMSLCKHHIIANSSFSWWGAWLGEHAGHIVVAPKKWFQDESRSTHDLIPQRWERL